MAADTGHALHYRPDIDGLRALAVLPVVGFHAFPHWMPGGFAGVDVFFVISGFLISSIILQAQAQGRFSFAGFYARRIARIFPALLLVMAACYAFGWHALFADEFRQLGKHIVGGGGFVSNFVLWNEVGYFDRSAETKPLLHLWSLGIEEQFYIVWPLLLLLAARRRWNLMLAAGVLVAVSFAINIAGVARAPSATFYSPASRVWELGAGAMLAIAAMRRPAAGAASFRHPGLLAAGGLLLLAGAYLLLDRDMQFPGWLALLPVLGACALIAAGPQAWVNRRVLAHPVLVGVGLISYPLYLWHWPLLSFAHIIESGTPARHLRVAAVAAAFVLAWLTYRLVERPVRFGLQGRGRIAALCLLMAAMAAAGGHAWLRDGLPQRASIVENLQQQKALVTVNDVANAMACKKKYGFDEDHEYCLLSQPDREPTVALIGDSHGFHISAGLKRHYDAAGENLLYMGTRIPFWGAPGMGDPYQEATPRMLDIALETPGIKTVLISTAMHFNSTPGGKALEAMARETIARYTRAGKRVIYMNDVPKMPFEPRACIRRAGIPSTATRTPCAMPRAEFERDRAEQDAALRDMAAAIPGLEVFSTAQALCDEKWCWAMRDGVLLYRDGDHLTHDGDLLVGRAFSARYPTQP